MKKILPFLLLYFVANSFAFAQDSSQGLQSWSKTKIDFFTYFKAADNALQQRKMTEACSNFGKMWKITDKVDDGKYTGELYQNIATYCPKMVGSSSDGKKGDSKRPENSSLPSEPEMNKENCNKLYGLLPIFFEQAASTIGVPIGTVRLLGPVWGSSHMYIDSCQVMLETPRGPYICPLAGLQNRGDNRVTGWGYGYNCQRSK